MRQCIQPRSILEFGKAATHHASISTPSCRSTLPFPSRGLHPLPSASCELSRSSIKFIIGTAKHAAPDYNKLSAHIRFVLPVISPLALFPSLVALYLRYSIALSVYMSAEWIVHREKERERERERELRPTVIILNSVSPTLTLGRASPLYFVNEHPVVPPLSLSLSRSGTAAHWDNCNESSASISRHAHSCERSA